MNFYPVRYWWTDKAGEHSAATVTSGQTPELALEQFKRDHPHVAARCAIITKPKKEKTP